MLDSPPPLQHHADSAATAGSDPPSTSCSGDFLVFKLVTAMENGSHGGPSFQDLFANADRKLGRGSYGSVQEATDARGSRVAVKTFDEGRFFRSEVLRCALAELTALQRAAHPRVAALLDVFVDTEAVRLVFEHGGQALHGLVATGLRRCPPLQLGPAGAQLIWRHCLEGLAWIHDHGIIHADLSWDLNCDGSNYIGPPRAHDGLTTAMMNMMMGMVRNRA